MTRRRLIALFVAWHLFAISVAALPPPSSLSHFPARDRADALNPFFYQVTIALDSVARVVEPMERLAFRVTRPLHQAVNYYVRFTGLSQTWSMFANPPHSAQYLRVRYYVQPPSGRTWMATELVLPTNREDQVRLFQSFRDSYRDKALAVAISRFFDKRKADLIAPQTRPDQLPTDLAPVARYFERDFARTHLDGQGGRVVRTELWIGSAPLPPFATPIEKDVLLDRSVALQSYYDGPVDQRFNIPPYPPYHAGEREADITWVLEYFEEH